MIVLFLVSGSHSFAGQKPLFEIKATYKILGGRIDFEKKKERNSGLRQRIPAGPKNPLSMPLDPPDFEQRLSFDGWRGADDIEDEAGERGPHLFLQVT